VKRFAGQNLQAFQVNFVPAIQLDVFFGEILADDADQFHRAKKARGDGGVAGRTAEQTRVFGLGVLMESSAVEPTIKTLIYSGDGRWEFGVREKSAAAVTFFESVQSRNLPARQ
jgi:hypothetical protein